MTPEQVYQLNAEGTFNGKPLQGELIETHISWVILTPEFTFKIKKPMQYHFLDFSTMEKRQFYCEREVMLNRRLTNIYLDVVQIVQKGDFLMLGKEEGDVIGHAVRMQTMDNALKMDKMLESGNIDISRLERLAIRIANFHKIAEVYFIEFDKKAMASLFNDITSVQHWVFANIGPGESGMIDRAVNISNTFLKAHTQLMQKRVEEGFYRDVHGDLHSKNIFLYEEPVIFDCIEFNDDMRRIDLINEVAFFCMDLEWWKREDLTQQFMNFYLSNFNIIRNEEEWSLFTYYKSYRANVRAKVNVLRAMQIEDKGQQQGFIEVAREYFALLDTYLDKLS